MFKIYLMEDKSSPIQGLVFHVDDLKNHFLKCADSIFNKSLQYIIKWFILQYIAKRGSFNQGPVITYQI